MQQLLARQCYTPAISLECQSDYQPELVQNAVNCGQNTLARYIAGVCDRNSRGRICGVAVLQELNGISNASTSCGSFYYDGSSCPSGCASQLRSLHNSLGCCINSLLNLTVDENELVGDSFARLFQILSLLEVFTYPLWSTCGVDTISTCESSTTITPIHNRPVCTTLELAQRSQSIQCNSDDAQSIVDSVIAAGDHCYDIGASFALACSSLPNGQYCTAIIAAGTENGDQAVTPTEISNSCSVGQRSCSSSCRSAVQAVSNSLGCCFNSIYNSTSTVPSAGFQFETSNALWDQCGVDTPGVCESTLDGSPPTAKAISLLVVAALLVLYIFV